MYLSRRSVLRGSAIGLASVAGCVGGGIQGSSNRQTRTERERVCTEAVVTSFNWDSKSGFFSDPEDEFEIALINRGDIAGTVVVSVKFWESRNKNQLQGSIERSVSVGAQATREITISAHKPTDDSHWASASVVNQDCQYR